MRTTNVIIFASLIVAASAASAGPEKGRFGIRIMGTGDFPVSGDFHRGQTAPVADLGVFNPALAGVPAELRIDPRSNSRIYNGMAGVLGEVSYGLSDNAELFGGFRYQSGGSTLTQIGVANVPGVAEDGTPTSSDLAAFGRFGRLKTYGGEIGYRQYFGGGWVKPYLAVRGGIAFTNAIRVDLSVPDGGIALNNTPFYRSSTSGTVGGDVGVAFPLNPKLDLNVETGIRWTSKLRGDDSAIGGLGLGNLNNAGERWDLPVRVGLAYRF
jgi:hypothetical protein